MLEFLLEPFIDTYFFGCPDSCIVPNSDTHEFLKILFTPLVVIGVSIGVVFGALFALGRLPDLESLRSFRSFRLRGKSVEQMIKDLPEADEVVHKEHEPKTIKQFERAIRKNDRKEFLKNLKDDLNPELAFDKFLEFQDPDHPQTETLKVARTEAKEKVKEEKKKEEPEVKMDNDKEQEFYKDNKESLEKQAKQVAELMKLENITEEEAIDRIIAEMPTGEEVVEEVVEGEKKEVDMDIDVFKQDNVEKEPKHFKFLHTQFKKKQKPKYKFKLTELGSKRRDEYARQVEFLLHDWAFPMPKYAGQNQSYQKDDSEIESGFKKLALFISMCEMMADRRRKKKNYWQKFKLVQ